MSVGSWECAYCGVIGTITICWDQEEERVMTRKLEPRVPEESITVRAKWHAISIDWPPGMKQAEMLNSMGKDLDRWMRPLGLKVSVYPGEGQNSSKCAGWPFEHPNFVLDKLVLKKDVDIVPFLHETELEDAQRIALEVITPRLVEGRWETVVPAIIHGVRRTRQILTNNHKTRLVVQLGIGRPFTHTELKRVCKTLLLFGHDISPAYPWVEHRKKNRFMESNRNSCLFQGMAAHQVLNIIDQTVDIAHLQWAMNTPIDAEFPPDPHYWYNLTLAASEHNPVIEFRCGYGIRYGGAAVAWISELKRVLVMALATPDEYFDQWAGKKGKYVEFLQARRRPDEEWKFLGVSSHSSSPLSLRVR